MRCPAIEDPRLIASSYARYLHDESSLRAAIPRRILFPTSLGELSSALLDAADHKEAVTISGARTGIVGAAVAIGGGNLLSPGHGRPRPSSLEPRSPSGGAFRASTGLES
ncbi:MAG TPA: hypothetical protein VMU36_04100 [Spirochaetia bacterium]|nr:hypothetical protein [Spirochaetia bacterium]